MTAKYFASFGTYQIANMTLRDARKAARMLANEVKHDINITRGHEGDVVYTARFRRARKVR